MHARRMTSLQKALYSLILLPLAAAVVTPGVGLQRALASAADTFSAALDGMNIYFGSTHGHSAYSDGEGTAQQVFTWARDTAGMDFYALTDHAEQLDVGEWADEGVQADNLTQDGVFVALRGFEWSSNSGHACVFDTGDYTNAIATRTFADFYAWLDGRNALAQFNHPLYESLFDNFEMSPAAADNFFALETGNWITGNNDSVPEDPAFLPKYPFALAKGWRIGPSFGQDNHVLTAYSGRTAVVAASLTRASLLDALRQRRFYSTDDSDMQVVFKCGDAWMGSVVQTGNNAAFTVQVKDNENISKLELISDRGEVVARQEYYPEADNRNVAWNPTVQIDRPCFFYLKVTEIDANHDDDGGMPNQLAVTSPLWVEPASASGAVWYLAEGYTGDGFQEYLSLANPQAAAAHAAVTYMLGDGSTIPGAQDIPAGSRATINVNAAVGAGKEVSVLVMADRDIVVERPVYFNYQGRCTGGHAVMGTGAPSATWYFAEGYTGAGFDSYLTIQNPGLNAATLALRFQTEGEGEKVIPGVFVAAHSRRTLLVNDLFPVPQQMSLKIEADTPVVAERPMYFDYLGFGEVHWEGGSCVMGARQLATSAYFAEGTTRSGFDEYLTLQNPGATPITVAAVYQLGGGQGENVQRSYRVEAGHRSTIFVPAELEREKDVSVQLTANAPFLAERPMYFDYRAAGSSRQGGHCVVGAAEPTSTWFFAEGYTGSGFDEYLCLQNPGGAEAWAEIDYYTQEQGPLPPVQLRLPAGTRTTVWVNAHAGNGLQNSCRVRVTAGPAIVAERPMYFDFGAWDGGSDVMGFASPGP